MTEGNIKEDHIPETDQWTDLHTSLKVLH